MDVVNESDNRQLPWLIQMRRLMFADDGPFVAGHQLLAWGNLLLPEVNHRVVLDLWAGECVAGMITPRGQIDDNLTPVILSEPKKKLPRELSFQSHSHGQRFSICGKLVVAEDRTSAILLSAEILEHAWNKICIHVECICAQQLDGWSRVSLVFAINQFLQSDHLAKNWSVLQSFQYIEVLR